MSLSAKSLLGHCPGAKIDAREELAANWEEGAKVAAIREFSTSQMEEAAVAAKVADALADEVGVNALKASHPGKMGFRLGGRAAR